ncbi:MAG: TrpB-like pyridoxal phosphate-dependent enzyme [Candidatus Nomurabacteria bacterium]|jgi:tryptophan synthase beta chain|nr:TrpB-like pyridoxal phosphate-dependent enzyme [Candidatus Nomurabacteria bacterium]
MNHKIYLDENEIPTKYYNLRADMPVKPAPMLRPDTKQPVTLADLEPIFARELARQELDDETRYFDIPAPVRDFYKIYRPSPLIRADKLEQALGYAGKIYYKYEGNNTSGSHKLNSAAAQVYYAKAEGVKSLTTETGAGQWGTALSEACSYFGMPLTVYMVKASFKQKPFRKIIMRTFGADIFASPSDTTAIGRKMLADDPKTTGSLGMAISEAIEKAVTSDNARYVLGSVLNQVLLHQSIIGLETEKAFQKIGEYPDAVIGCAGGGSNLGGLIAPFMRDKIKGKKAIDIIAVEPKSCPSFTRGRFAYDFCDTGNLTPLARMYTLGSGFVPSADHAGGLRYHGMSPVLSRLYADGQLSAEAYKQTEVFEAATLFAKHEQILPAPESAHAIKGAIEYAKRCQAAGETKTILFGLTGTGYFDLAAYESYQNGTMKDYVPSDAELAKSLKNLPQTP